MRRIDRLIISIDLLAIVLCIKDNPLSAPVFVVAMVIGLIDAIRNENLSGGCICTMFLALNLFNTIKLFV